MRAMPSKPITIKPWSPVRSARKPEVHMSHDGIRVLCNARMYSMVPAADEYISCPDCYEAYTFN